MYNKLVELYQLLRKKDNATDSDLLRRKIFIYTATEGLLIFLLLAFSVFLFHVMVG